MEAVAIETSRASNAGISLDLSKFNLLKSLKQAGTYIIELYEDFRLGLMIKKAMKEPGFVSEEEIMEALGQ
jgi:hypothetical protein